jgi:hypothetical protein
MNTIWSITMKVRQEPPCRTAHRVIAGLAWILALAVMAGAAHAQVAKQSFDTLSSLQFTHDRLAQSQPVEPFDSVQSQVDRATQAAWASFQASAPVEWRAAVDKRHGLIAFAEGGEIAWIPGSGNSLEMKDIASFLTPGAQGVDLPALERIARSELPRLAALLGFNPRELAINLGRSGQPAGHVWFVDFDVIKGGLPLEGARVVFRINNGNLVQFGSENLPARGAAVPPTRLTREQALAAVAKYVGGLSSADSFLDGGSLHLLPVNIQSTRSAEGFDFGNGRGLAKVWQFTFHRDGVLGTWRARVDAATGEMLELMDSNDYGTAAVTGGIFQNSPTTGPEIVRPMPFADAGGSFTNSAGLYNFTAATNSTLFGQFVRINDTCGAISQASDGSGNIAFGTSTGTDCTTPGHGGAGNTHASREQFYQVNRIKEVARGWLPSNTWLGQVLTVNVNLNQICNAYWNGFSLNFFKSGGGCNNTGELSGVSLHEFGHGLDQNDGTGTAPEGGTGESYADITAAIALHSSCIGPGFFASGNCGGYGDSCTACSGVRDIDYAKHVSNTPATVASFTQLRCGSGFGGPCGGEVHCESYVPSEAIWDFANRDLPGAGTGPAWTILDRLWYLSRDTSTSSFTCFTGATYTSNGCGIGNWWKTMRAVDDDDGNLSNGTPHSGALFAAFDRHGIACPTDAGASTSFRGCTQPATPTLTASGGGNSVSLSWTASGSAVYDVFRNETGCNAGFTKIASGTSATSLTDTNVANGITYFYQVTAFPAGNEACASAPSACISIDPSQTAPAAPAAVTATASGTSVVVTWSASANADAYHLERKVTGQAWIEVAATPVSSNPPTTLTDTTPPLTDDGIAVYRVRASQGVLFSPYSPSTLRIRNRSRTT